MAFKNMIKELLNLLYWAMLAANTIGPGTVVTCARAGSEYQLHLVWALVFASILAFIFQEGSARLTIISGKGLGECLRIKYSNGRKFWKAGVLSWLVIILLFIGNTLYECNTFAGGITAVYALPPVEQTIAVRWISCLVYAVVVFAILYVDKVNSLGVGLGIVTIGMVVLFLIMVVRLGLNGKRLAKSFFAVSIPSGSINIVLSLVGTTSVGFNLFLGSEMARGGDLRSARCGIAFSTFMTMIISILIVIVGDGTHGKHKGPFTMEVLVDIIERLSGNTGRWVFGISFIAAALSSMLATPLGAALTADSFLTINDHRDDNVIMSSVNGKVIEEESGINSEASTSRPFPRKYYIGMMFVIVVVATIVIGANTPRVLIILIAQVFNGCLLPFFSTCLLICVNDPVFMKKSPQKGWANCFLIIGVWITVFLTSNTIIQNAFGWTVTKHYTTTGLFQRWSIVASAVASLVIMVIVFITTDLGANVKKSFSTLNKRGSTVGVTN